MRDLKFAIRAALGAGRTRLVRQLLSESLLLAALGGVVGLAFAGWGAQLLAAFPIGGFDYTTPYSVPRNQVRLDSGVLVFACVLSGVTALLCGLMPALRGSKPDLASALKATTMETFGSRLLNLRSVLVTGEVAVSLVLLIGAGLLLRSLARLQDVSPGFQTANLLTANLSLPRTKHGPQVIAFHDQLLAGVRALPGVKAAALVEYLPMSGADSSSIVHVEGAPDPGPGNERRAHNRNVSPDYFNAMCIPLLQGREFDARDGPGSLKVAVINETMARRYWPGENAVGRRVALVFESMRFRPNGPPEFDLQLGLREIVGVVADVKHTALDAAPVPEMYVPQAQRPVNDMTLVVRTMGEPDAIARAVESQVAALDKDQPISGISTMSQLIGGSIAQPRFQTGLLAVFAASALILAAVGLYGLIAFSVSQRTREIGIRMALGARRSDVLRSVLWEGMKPVGAGMVLGWTGALALMHLIRNLLFGVAPTDPVTFVGIPILLAGVALLASWFPARRAARVDPMEALRYE